MAENYLPLVIFFEKYRHATPSLCINSVEQVDLSHLVTVHKKSSAAEANLVALKVANIKTKCIFISLPNTKYDYVCKQLNNVEHCK
jgi:hypothetical protein